MTSVIIEDEKQSAEHLNILLKDNYPKIKVLARLRSVEESLDWFNANNEPDIVFIDIELSDGTCFEILEETKLKSKLIFTTAYDQHAIKAFEYNSIAYLLKPISAQKLNDAIKKLQNRTEVHNDQIIEELKNILKPEYKKRFLVKRGDKYWHIPIADIAYFVSEEGLTVAYLFDGRKHFIEHTLDQIERLINPVVFFRINRKYLLNIDCIRTVKVYFTRRLLVETEPKYSDEIIVSKERVNDFKKWLNE